MVSIPDWGRSQRSQRLKAAPARSLLSSRERYERALERQAIKEAESKGYFLTPRLVDIVNEFGRLDGIDNGPCQEEATALSYLATVTGVIYSGRHLRAAGDLGMCSKLRVAMLDNNYLHDISPLCACSRLVMLGLQSNQLSTLPGADFWSELQQLQIVLLHDNPIDNVDVVHALANCSQLCGLTLYDTPVSLKKNYRHHVVNTVYSLKALDRHVISDEEIIEDAVFKGSRYAAMGHGFLINMTRGFSSRALPGELVEAVADVVAEINRIAAHNCPVLVLQKFFRGWCVRRQRQSQHARGRLRAANWRSPQRHSGQIAAKIHTMQKALQTEVKAHRQHTTSPVSSPVFSVSASILAANSGAHEALAAPPVPKHAHAGLVVDLSQLQMSIAKVLDRDESRKQHGSSLAGGEQAAGKVEQTSAGRVAAAHGRGDAEAAAPLEGARLPGNAGVNDGGSSADELPECRFRLRGFQSVIHRIVPIEQAIVARKDAGHDLRDMVADAHERLAGRPRPSVVKSSAKVKDKFIFARLHDTMSLSCLRAVHQAYADRQQEEAVANRSDATAEQRQQRTDAAASVRAFAEERRLAALKRRDADKKSALEAEERQQLDSLHGLNLKNEQKQRAQRKRDLVRAEQAFVNDFRTQQTSVSKALLRHDWQSKKDGAQGERSQTVASAKDSQKEKQHIIKRYLDHRSKMRQTENSVTRAAIDNRILQSMTDHLDEVRSRVNRVRSTRYQPPQPYSVPNVTMSVPSVPSAPNATPDWRSDFRSAAAESRVGLAPLSVRRDRSSRLQAQA